MRTLPQKSVAAALHLAWLVALVCPACEPGSAKITGNTARVVGERITLVLVEGEESFSASVRLHVTEKEIYNSEQLRVERLESGRKLALSIPTGITAGPAVLFVRKEGSPEEYEIPLTIDRLAAFVTETGELHLVPLPPATAEAQAQQVGSDGKVLLSMSDDSTTVVTANADQLALFRVSADISENRVTGKAPGVVLALAALPNGAVVATPSSSSGPAGSVVRLYQANTDDGLKEADSRLIEGATVKALAAVDRGAQRPKVAILTDCDGGGDCVIIVDFAVPANQDDLTAHAVDDTSSANMIAISGDGRVVAVPDNDVIHGIDFADASPVSSSLPWSIDGSADPVGITQTRTPVGDAELQDVFAAAERASGTVRLFGAPDGSLLSLAQQPPTMPTPPLAVSFGRDREIFVLTADRQLWSIAAGGSQFRPVGLAVPKQAIDLAVQR